VTSRITSEMVANVWQIHAEPGANVAEGDTIMILESMKMEIPIEADAAGIVRSIQVTEGQVVQEGDLLAEIDYDGAN
jgi:acetyl-CoA carboxylase biotin carboxyl carrier protein